MIQEAFLELKDISLYIENRHEYTGAMNRKRSIPSHRASETEKKILKNLGKRRKTGHVQRTKT